MHSNVFTRHSHKTPQRHRIRNSFCTYVMLCSPALVLAPEMLWTSASAAVPASIEPFNQVNIHYFGLHFFGDAGHLLAVNSLSLFDSATQQRTSKCPLVHSSGCVHVFRFSSMTQFPQPCGFSWCITCGSILSERRIAELEPSKKHLFRSHSRCASVPVLSVFLSFLGARSNKLCQFRTSSGFSTRPHLAQTKWYSCLATLLCLQTWSSLLWPNLFVCRQSSSAAWPHLIGLAGGAKVHNDNTQRHFRVVCNACVCAE